MKILIANLGSTSYKCKLYDSSDMSVLFKASIERIGHTESTYIFSFEENNETTIIQKIPDYLFAVNLTLKSIQEQFSISEIDVVGFKTVHAKGLSGCVRLNSEVITAMEE